LALPSVINENTKMLLVGATISNHLVFTLYLQKMTRYVLECHRTVFI